MKKTWKYKGWQIKYNERSGEDLLYTPQELEQPVEFRQEEEELLFLELAQSFIDHYND